MERQKFIDALFARAKAAGFEACEVYYSASSSFEAGVLKGEVISYNVSDSMGLGFRGMIGGKMGYSSTQILDEEAIDLLVDGAKTNAELIENEDKQFIHPGDAEYAAVDSYNPAMEGVSAAEKIEMARELERKTLAIDPRVSQISDSSVVSECVETSIVNTLGLNVSRRANVMGATIESIARDGDKVSSGWAYRFASDPSRVSLDEIAAEAVEIAVDGLDAESTESGMTRILLHPDAATSFLSTFAGIFSAEAAQKDLSLLKGREGEQVASECVTILDDPLRADSFASKAFDGEGVATKVKKVIDHGCLTTLLHNLKTANKQGVASTGNAARGYASTVGIAPSNFYFQPSDASFAQMLEKLGDGLLITDVAGLHAGANAISGDFSLSAQGYRVRGGQRAEAVNQITVAGNFYQMLKDIEAVGSDLRFGFPSGSCFGSPSLLISGLSVAGK